MPLVRCPPGRARCAAGASASNLKREGGRGCPASRHVSATSLEKQPYAVPPVRTSRLERPDAAFLELAAKRVVSVPLERSDLYPLRRRAPHGARDRAAAGQAYPDGSVRALRGGATAARARSARKVMDR